MKSLLTLLLTTCLAFTQTTGQLYYQKKTAVGYTSNYLTPIEGQVPVWISGVLGNLNIAGTYATQASLSSYSLTSHAHTFGSLTSKPTTLSGYGITDAPSGSGTATGTNTGDNAANTNYAADYRAANFVAGTNYLAPNGSAAALTGFPTLNQNTTGSAASVTNLTLGGATTISTGGTIALGGFTATIPATGTVALRDAANTFTAAQTNSTAGATSLPAAKWTGIPFAGTGTTSFPLVYINDANATASSTLNTAGTYFGINGDGSQDLINLLKDGVSKFKVANDGTTLLGNATGSWFQASNFYFGASGTATAKSTGSGLIQLMISAETSGITFDVTTDGTLKLRNRSNTASTGNLDIGGTSTFTGTVTAGAGVIQSPPASATPVNNGQMLFEATSNTSLTVKLKGTDGTVRSVVLTLAP